MSFKVPILVAHQTTYARREEVPAIFVDDKGYGILWNRTFLQIDPGHPFPIAGTLIRYLELQVGTPAHRITQPTNNRPRPRFPGSRPPDRLPPPRLRLLGSRPPEPTR